MSKDRDQVTGGSRFAGANLMKLTSPVKPFYPTEVIAKLRMAWDMPWLVRYEIRRWLAWPWIRLMFRAHGIAWGKDWKIWGMPVIQRHRGSHIMLGEGLHLRSWASTNPLVPNHPVVLATRTNHAIIQVGSSTGMTGVTIVAADRIEIGDRVLIGSNAIVTDTDFHPLDPKLRQSDILAGKHNPVVIGDDVFIGMNSLILKGVTIGSGAVVGAGSVVVEDVPPAAIAVGNPSRVIGQSTGSEPEY